MKYFLIFLALITLSACDQNRIYEDYKELDESFWHRDSVQQFSFAVADIEKNYTLSATFRNASGYPFYNLYFQYSLLDSTGNVILEELKDVSLFDPKTGKPNGDGLGDLFDHRFALQENYTFSDPGKYTLALQHFMRRDTLPLILSVGARVEFSE